MKTKVLYITSLLEHPAAGGPQLRVETSIKALSQLCELHVCSRCSLPDQLHEQTKSFFSKICDKRVIFAPPTRKPALVTRVIRKILRELGRNPQDSKTIQDAHFLVDYVHRQGVPFVWFGHATGGSYPLMKLMKKLDPDLRVICDTDSVWSRFVLRGLPYAKSDLERRTIQKDGLAKEDEEQDWVNYAEVITAASEIDADYYLGLAKHPNHIHIFSNVIDLETYEQAPSPVEDYRRPCIYLAGSFSHQSPMADAARWVIAEVLPLVRRQIPDIHFYVVGKGSDQILSDIDNPGITTTGKVPSVLPYLCYADVALVPLRWESGTRFKILEAGACGIPVVSTTLGAEGLSVTHEKDILIADEPGLFADSIVRLIKDRNFATKISENLRTLVVKEYSITSLVRQGRCILDYLLQTPGVES